MRIYSKGIRFGSLVVVGPASSNPRTLRLLCRCDCGAEVIRRRGDLKHSSCCSRRCDYPLASKQRRFWSQVAVGDGCWAWVGRLDRYGYGRFSYRCAEITAHRMAWMLEHGKHLSRQEHVCHTCDNPPCVRPSHLFVGTHADNMRDMARKKRAVPPPPHARMGNAKLKPEQVRQIRRLVGHKTHAEIADMFGVSGATISIIRNRRVWRHI